jgi:hypothetical protein
MTAYNVETAAIESDAIVQDFYTISNGGKVAGKRYRLTMPQRCRSGREVIRAIATADAILLTACGGGEHAVLQVGASSSQADRQR